MNDNASLAIEFRVTRDADRPAEVEPYIGGTSLCDLVGDYERGRGYAPSGAYGGLVPENFRFGDLAAYLIGHGRRQWPQPGRLWLLACDCGDVGCWPLEAAVFAGANDVTWSDFRQPHRSHWRYDGFGPFVFPREQYEAAVAQAVERLRDGDS